MIDGIAQFGVLMLLLLTGMETDLKEVVAPAERYNTEPRTAVSVDDIAEEAILKEADAGWYDLIFMGVDLRPGAAIAL